MTLWRRIYLSENLNWRASIISLNLNFSRHETLLKTRTYSTLSAFLWIFFTRTFSIFGGKTLRNSLKSFVPFKTTRWSRFLVILDFLKTLLLFVTEWQVGYRQNSELRLNIVLAGSRCHFLEVYGQFFVICWLSQIKFALHATWDALTNQLSHLVGLKMAKAHQMRILLV